MRRGFLNKWPKTKSKKPESEPNSAGVEQTPEPANHTTNLTAEKDASCENSTGTKSNADRDNEPPFNPHRPPEWLIKERSKNGETRFIFREWPRDPKGSTTVMEAGMGKQAPGGIPYWGATLYDFYSYRPIAELNNYIMSSTGSRLAAKMRELGELEAAAPEIMWADMEEDPRQLVLPNEIGRDLTPWEDRLSWLRTEYQSVRDAEHARATEVPLPEPTLDEHCNIAEIKPENYPGPWPIVPFSFLKRGQPKLETIIPYTLLPKKLIVHDPWKLLAMKESSSEEKSPPDATVETDWSKMPDIIHVYELQPLTSAALLKSERQHEVYRKRVDDSDFLIVSEETDEKNDEKPLPTLRIKVPPYPHKDVTPAAHLYISPGSKAGTGHHSEVYHAAWELPRALLVPEVFCRQCVHIEIRAMAESGELERIVAGAVGDEPYGYVDEKVEVQPQCVVDVSKRTLVGHKHDESVTPEFRIVEPRKVERTRVYQGPIVDIHTKVKWQTPGRGANCVHIQTGFQFGGPDERERTRPPTAVVRVCAKLSREHDSHLAREAKVYQAFPAHLSEHWSGYNLVRPSHEPVPVGAVVPQFYGYYTPAACEPNATYLSPVMLLEDCGTPLDLTGLSADQKKECWSLVYRLHHADWVHESVAERNIMMQSGPLTTPQGWLRGYYELGTAEGVSFRVIDFGRSLYCGPPAKEGEEDVYVDLRARDKNVDDHIYRERGDVDRLLSCNL
ncbi:hypothetical protein C8F04DRAFT_1073861 [Mycena alexandri]|uniref:Protein kinase domain-containing protein n=1 Tax=Mycena alexandri TaxID=1745969 RepID=A0AAD6TDM0_9AGAR|nr:hypothetical protein C8F04DRAFT_1073861 [Mycena alexandri]